MDNTNFLEISILSLVYPDEESAADARVLVEGYKAETVAFESGSPELHGLMLMLKVKCFLLSGNISEAEVTRGALRQCLFNGRARYIARVR